MPGEIFSGYGKRSHVWRPSVPDAVERSGAKDALAVGLALGHVRAQRLPGRGAAPAQGTALRRPLARVAPAPGQGEHRKQCSKQYICTYTHTANAYIQRFV